MDDTDDDYMDKVIAEEIEMAEISKEVLELLKKERAKLKEKGLDVDFMIAELEATVQKADDARAHLEDLRLQYLMSMSESVIKGAGPATTAVRHADMAAKDLRKDEDVMEYFRRLQRRLKRFDEEKKQAQDPEGSN